MVRIAPHGRCDWNLYVHRTSWLPGHVTLYLRLLLNLVLALALGGCQLDTAPPVQSLVFTSIERQKSLPSASSKPALYVIARPADYEALFGQWPDSSIAQHLRHLDYTQVFAIVVEEGLQRRTCRAVEVQQVTRVGDQVGVHAVFINPRPPINGRPKPLCDFVPSDPYELITVLKDGTWGRPIQFGLVVDGKTIVKTTHVIP